MQAAKAREELTEWNRGVFWSADLVALEADAASVVARGIRRAKDKVHLPHPFGESSPAQGARPPAAHRHVKLAHDLLPPLLRPQVVLPPSAGASLMAQDAPRNGAMLFRLRSRATGAVTHAGLLDFTAPEGVALLPRKVRECLYGNGGAIPPAPPAPPAAVGGAAPAPQPDLEVTYVRLEKGTFVRFQPLTRGFHERVVGEDVRAVLEATLMQCSALSEGDTLRVEHLGEEHVLRVSGGTVHARLHTLAFGGGEGGSSCSSRLLGCRPLRHTALIWAARC